MLGKRIRDLALFNLAIDSKLRGCDLVGLRVRNVAHGDHVLPRATVIKQKTGRPVRFELTDQTRPISAGVASVLRFSIRTTRSPDP